MEVKLAFCLACMLALLATAQANDTYIPSTTGGDNYYNFYGGPSLSASVSGTDEFSRGDTVTLYVDLTNYGRITGFKQDKVPNTATEYALANAEQQEEAKITTAFGVKATLISNTSQVEVKSGDQVVQSLKTGDKTTQSDEVHHQARRACTCRSLPSDLENGVRLPVQCHGLCLQP